MNKKRKHKKIIKLLSSICLILLVITIIIIININKEKNNTENKLVGEWTTDGVTIYKFNEDNTGTLIVPLSKYKFNYKIDDDKLFIDFENKKSTDSEYTYSIKKDKLLLKSKNGKFTFKKHN